MVLLDEHKEQAKARQAEKVENETRTKREF